MRSVSLATRAIKWKEEETVSVPLAESRFPDMFPYFNLIRRNDCVSPCLPFSSYSRFICFRVYSISSRASGPRDVSSENNDGALSVFPLPRGAQVQTSRNWTTPPCETISPCITYVFKAIQRNWSTRTRFALVLRLAETFRSCVFKRQSRKRIFNHRNSAPLGRTGCLYTYDKVGLCHKTLSVLKIKITDWTETAIVVWL